MGDVMKPQRRFLSAALVVSAAGFVLAPAPTVQSREEPSLESLMGGWVLESSAPEATIVQAIEHATDEMPFGIRQIAQHALRQNTPIVYNVIIASRGNRLAVTYDRHTYRGPFDGSEVDAVGPAGREVSLRYRMEEGGALVQEVRADEGGREDTLRVESGKLWVSARIHHPDLPNDVRFQLRYRAR